MIRSMFTVPAGPERKEIVVVNSRFIASLDYASSAGDARAFISRIRREYPDASHNVPAFIVGGGNSSTEFCSDDGEPAGTSGRPLLSVLRGSGLGDTVIVVTRYFGGTLLGTGGLVKAYSEAGRQVLECVRRASLVEFRRFSLELPYAIFEGFRKLAAEAGAMIAGENFDEMVHILVDVPSEESVRFESRLADLASGSVAMRSEGARMERILVHDRPLHYTRPT